jgi:hypothetical protein
MQPPVMPQSSDPSMAMPQPGAMPPQTGMAPQSNAPGLFNMSGPQTIPDSPVAAKPDMPAPNPYAYQRQKPSVLGVISDALAGLSGHEGTYGKMLMEQGQTQRMMAMQSAHIQQQQQAELYRMNAEHQFKVDNPIPNEDERLITASGIDIHSDQGRAAARQLLDRRGDPLVTMTLPNGMIYSGPSSGLNAALSGQGAHQTGDTYGPVVNTIPGGGAGNGPGHFPH